MSFVKKYVKSCLKVPMYLILVGVKQDEIIKNNFISIRCIYLSMYISTYT